MKVDQGELVNKLRATLAINTPSFSGDIAPRVPAAVLVPFCFTDGEWHLLFTKRTNGVAKHQGEISFPGGAAEDGDRDLIETAVRETCEEIGLGRNLINVIGVMEPIPTVSNYCVLPVVGLVKWPSKLKINPSEVEDVILIPVSWLKQPKNWHVDDFFYEPGTSKPVIHYEDFKGEHLWGITAGLAQKITSVL